MDNANNKDRVAVIEELTEKFSEQSYENLSIMEQKAEQRIRDLNDEIEKLGINRNIIRGLKSDRWTAINDILEYAAEANEKVDAGILLVASGSLVEKTRSRLHEIAEKVRQRKANINFLDIVGVENEIDSRQNGKLAVAAQ